MDITSVTNKTQSIHRPKANCTQTRFLLGNLKNVVTMQMRLINLDLKVLKRLYINVFSEIEARGFYFSFFYFRCFFIFYMVFGLFHTHFFTFDVVLNWKLKKYRVFSWNKGVTR